MMDVAFEADLLKLEQTITIADGLITEKKGTRAILKVISVRDFPPEDPIL